MSETSQRSATGHAVILGAGMAGLFAARVLSEQYARVTLIDRDPLPGRSRRTTRGAAGPARARLPGPRCRGRRGAVPGLVAELVEAAPRRSVTCPRRTSGSAATCSASGRSRSRRSCWRAGPTWSTASAAGSRHCRTSGSATAWRWPDSCTSPPATATATALVVTGVRVARPAEAPRTRCPPTWWSTPAAGGSRTPAWLEELGYERPTEERIAVRVRVREPDPPPGDPGRRPAVRDRGPSARAATSASRCSGASAGPGPSP